MSNCRDDSLAKLRKTEDSEIAEKQDASETIAEHDQQSNEPFDGSDDPHQCREGNVRVDLGS